MEALSEKQLENFKAEIEVMTKLYHPNIALFMGAFINPKAGQIKLVSELLTCDIEKILLDENVPMTLYERMELAEQAAEGMAWLHGAGVIHCDFKPSNLLYEERTKTVKICDFGLSRLVPYGDVLQGTKVRGSAIYIAPEVAQGQGIDHTADVYAFGISLYEFIERKIPFAHHSDIKTFLQAVVLDMERPVLSNDLLKVPESLRQLCEECWAADKTVRPTFVELLARFPAVLTDCAIFDERGRKFWKQHFIDAEEGLIKKVPWEDFREPFHMDFWGENIPSDLETAQCIKALFDEKGFVTVDSFGRILGFLGPLRKTKRKWINWITSLMAQPWFWGDCSGNLAQSKLMVPNVPNGAFLIRFSRMDANFTLSYVHGGRVWHTRIVHAYGSASFMLEGGKTEYSSLGAFVEALKAKGVVTSPVPGWPYEPLFGDVKSQGGYAILPL